MYACLRMSLVGAALISTSVAANAADVPRPPVRSPIATIYDWTGFYAGGHVGGGWVDNGDGGKKIWMTEIGAPTSAPSAAGVSQDEQAREITDVLWKASESGFSGPAFIFSIRDIATADQGDEQNNFGALLTSDWQPKVAAGVLAR